jgi:hypothetical protein
MSLFWTNPSIPSFFNRLTAPGTDESFLTSNNLLQQKTATQHLADLKAPPSKLTGHRPFPEIIEFLNICDYTHQVESKVGVEEPLFQPYPPEISYHKYEPFKARGCTSCIQPTSTDTSLLT